MANFTGQVTIPAGGKVSLSAGIPANMAPNTFVQQLIVQNNAAHPIRFGDVTVSTTVPAAVSGGTAGRGILLASGSPGGTVGPGAYMNYGVYLSDRYVAGIAGDVIDFDFVQ